MIDLTNNKCAHQGCTKVPSFGVAGSKKGELCSGHAQQGMSSTYMRKRARNCGNKGAVSGKIRSRGRVVQIRNYY